MVTTPAGGYSGNGVGRGDSGQFRDSQDRGGVSRHQVVNATFDEALRNVYGSAGTEQLRAGVYAALGAPHSPDAPDPAQYPLLGYYLSPSDDAFLLYALTPGRFIRYEVDTNSQSLTIVTPVHRVTRVVERTAPNHVTLLIELDADTLTTTEEYRESTDPTDPSVLIGRTAGKVTRTFYEMVATTPDDGMSLMEFARALRNVVGT